MKLTKLLFLGLFLAATPIMLTACDNDESSIEESMEEAGESMEEVGEEISDEVDDATTD